MQGSAGPFMEHIAIKLLTRIQELMKSKTVQIDMIKNIAFPSF